jgi:uncharacterized protein (TIRG00374 family)
VRKHWGTIAGILISLVALALAVRGVPLDDLRQTLAGANYWWVLPSLVVLLASYATRALRWWGLLRAQVSLPETFHAMNAGYLLNNVLPLRLGEVARAYLLSRGRAVTGMETLSTIVAERVLDLLAAVAILAVTLPLVAAADWMRSAGLTMGMVAVAGFVGLWLAAHQRALILRLAGWFIQRIPFLSAHLARLLEQAGHFLNGLESLRDNRRLVSALFWSAATWALSGAVCWLLLFVFLPQASLALGFYVVGVAAVGYAVPSSPGQAGVLEAALVAALVPLAIPHSAALSYAIVLHLASYATAALLGGFALAHYGETLAGLARAAQSFLGQRKPAASETG